MRKITGDFNQRYCSPANELILFVVGVEVQRLAARFDSPFMGTFAGILPAGAGRHYNSHLDRNLSVAPLLDLITQIAVKSCEQKKYAQDARTRFERKLSEAFLTTTIHS